MSRAVTIRVRSSEGTQRVTLSARVPLSKLIEEVAPKFNTDAVNIRLSRKVDGSEPLKASDSIHSSGLTHGDMIYAQFTSAPDRASAEPSAPLLADPVLGAGIQIKKKVNEDAVDVALRKKDGWIKREYDQTTCFRHPKNGSCVHCMPLPPWSFREAEPWASQKIPHIPFHAWLRNKEDRGVCRHPKGVGISCQACQVLQEPSYKVLPCSSGHLPWPEGICSKCKPDTIRLMGQAYRHVDHVQIEAAPVIGQLYDAWRQSGAQRAGYLYGQYVEDDRVPLGIRAVVQAVYEPPQRGNETGVILRKDPDAEDVDAFAALFGMRRIGFAYTAIEAKDGHIIVSRDLDETFLVSGGEYMHQALNQTRFPNPCADSLSGVYGSKFFSVMLTGVMDAVEGAADDSASGKRDADALPVVNVGPIAYQVSDQAACMVRDGIVRPSENPKFLRVDDDNPKVYVPKVLYEGENEYKARCVMEAKPTFPPEFFHVSLPTPTVGASSARSLFVTHTFPPENRPWSPASAVHLSLQFEAGSFADNIRDWHLLLWLRDKLAPDAMTTLARAIVDNDLHAMQAAQEQLRPFMSASASPTASTTSAPSSSSTHPQQEAWLSTLADMGYPREMALRALRETGFSGLEAAVERLLS